MCIQNRSFVFRTLRKRLEKTDIDAFLKEFRSNTSLYAKQITHRVTDFINHWFTCIPKGEAQGMVLKLL